MEIVLLGEEWEMRDKEGISNLFDMRAWEKEKLFKKMHQKGWALQKYNVCYTFKKTEPKMCI